MTLACIEHVNVTVENPDQVAKLLCSLFDWTIRWSGESKDNGYTVHVGSANRYLALYTHANSSNADHDYFRHGTLNHIGLVVKNSDRIEQEVIKQGLTTQNHRDYGPCKSFYFMAEKTLEIEIVCYKDQS